MSPDDIIAKRTDNIPRSPLEVLIEARKALPEYEQGSVMNPAGGATFQDDGTLSIDAEVILEPRAFYAWLGRAIGANAPACPVNITTAERLHLLHGLRNLSSIQPPDAREVIDQCIRVIEDAPL